MRPVTILTLATGFLLVACARPAGAQPLPPALGRVAPEDVSALRKWLEGCPRLTSVAADAPLEALESLDGMVKGARVIALGECAHGVREFATARHLVTRLLIERHACEHVVLEALWGRCHAVNEFVLHGKGDAKKAVAGLGTWLWDTEETVAFLEWLRAWNAREGRRHKVRVHGMDVQLLDEPLEMMLAAVAAVDPGLASRARRGLHPLSKDRSHPAGSDYRKLPSAERDAVLAVLQGISRALKKRRTAGVEDMKKAVLLDRARAALDVVMQGERLWRATTLAEGARLRDQHMAERVVAAVTRARPGARVVVWAHNGHAGKTAFVRSVPSMGQHLARRFGESFLSIGMTFGAGSIQVLQVDSRIGQLVDDVNLRRHQGLRVIAVSAPRPFSLESLLRDAVDGNAFIDLRSAPDPARRVLDVPHALRRIPALYNPRTASRYQARVRLRGRFDALLFMGAVTPARYRDTAHAFIKRRFGSGSRGREGPR